MCIYMDKVPACPECEVQGESLKDSQNLACALSVISLLLIQKFFALLKSDHNDNYIA